MSKIKSISIKHFRGIPNEMSLDFSNNGEPTSFLIYGDNGSGKSSIIDAIELSTQGTILAIPSLKSDKWIYSSVSLTGNNDRSYEIVLTLENGEKNRVEIEKDPEKGRAVGELSILQCFRHAPFVLRRQDILNFWSLPSQQKLNIFRSFVTIDTDSMEVSDSEKLEVLESERLNLKNEKREIIERLSKFYNLDAKEISEKPKRDVFSYIFLFEKVKGIKEIKKKQSPL